MGVTLVYKYELAADANIGKIIEELSKRFKQEGASPAGEFLVECETITSKNVEDNTTKTLHLMHNTEYPNCSFAILENEEGKPVPVVADSLFHTMFVQMDLNVGNNTVIRSNGCRYKYGDFLIKLGAVTMVDLFKGIIIEFEYQPCVVLTFCWEMMREQLQRFVGLPIAAEYPVRFTATKPAEPNSATKCANDDYEPMDTMFQYLEVFKGFRSEISMLPSQAGPRPDFSYDY